MKEISLSEMVPVSECLVGLDGRQLALSGYGYARTPGAYTVPLRIEAVAKTDSTNLRLHFSKGHIVFNWEASPGQMACYEPVYGHPFTVKEQGQVPEDTWVRVTWVIREDHMQVLVDDELRYANKGETGDEFHRINYRGLMGPVGIGPEWGSTVTVRSLSVGELE